MRGFVSLSTEIRENAWWVVLRTGDGQESFRGPYTDEASADGEASRLLPFFFEQIEACGMKVIPDA